jgi:hypothetical protein
VQREVKKQCGIVTTRECRGPPPLALTKHKGFRAFAARDLPQAISRIYMRVFSTHIAPSFWPIHVPLRAKRWPPPRFAPPPPPPATCPFPTTPAASHIRLCQWRISKLTAEDHFSTYKITPAAGVKFPANWSTPCSPSSFPHTIHLFTRARVHPLKARLSLQAFTDK